MSTRKSNNDSHFSGVPLTQKSRDILNTTFRDTTNKKRMADTFSSCAFSAQQVPACVHSAASSYQFVQTPHEGAPTVERCPRFPATVGAAIPEAGPCGFDWEDIS